MPDKHLTTPKTALPVSDQGVIARTTQDVDVRINMRPRTPPTPTVSFATTSITPKLISATLTWSPTQKDMDYIVRSKPTTATNYSYTRVKTSPAVIFPVPTGSINFALSQEWRATGSRSGFTGDITGTTP